MPTLGIVVPALELGGGVPAVAKFLVETAERAPAYDVRLVSLSSSATDDASTRIAEPASWFVHPRVVPGVWEGRPFQRVGVRFAELEFRRYSPRPILGELLADCHVVQVVAGTPAWAMAACGLNMPVSVQCATLAAVERRRKGPSRHTLLAAWRAAMTILTGSVERRALERVDAIQVENRWMLDYARAVNRGRNVDLRYAPPGIDEDVFSPSAGRDVASGYILCVGRLDDPRKNIELLLEAYAMLPANVRDDWPLILAGQAAPVESFWARTEHLGLGGRVRFERKPSQAALVSLYRNASVFALPSDEEGLGVALLEAMSCGIPAVSTRSGGPDGVISDAVDGFLVNRDDAKAMADRIARLHSDEDLNRRMGAEARRTIERRYTKVVAGDVFRDVWSSLTRA